jgi:RNase P subunit RPR2
MPEREKARIPASLGQPIPAMSEPMRELVDSILQQGCNNIACKGSRAQIRFRILETGGTQVVIQCLSCGRALRGGMALKQSKFSDIKILPLFDYNLRESHWESWKAMPKSQKDFILRELDPWWVEYSAALLTPEWETLRRLTLERAGFTCEACGTRKAVQAHHLNYSMGFFPPLWLLKAVCYLCHDRLHADHLGKTDEWCLRAKPESADTF